MHAPEYALSILPSLCMIEVRDCPERDIWSLGVMVQGSGQMGELLGRRRRRRRRRRRQLEIGV